MVILTGLSAFGPLNCEQVGSLIITAHLGLLPASCQVCGDPVHTEVYFLDGLPMITVTCFQCPYSYNMHRDGSISDNQQVTHIAEVRDRIGRLLNHAKGRMGTRGDESVA